MVRFCLWLSVILAVVYSPSAYGMMEDNLRIEEVEEQDNNNSTRFLRQNLSEKEEETQILSNHNNGMKFKLGFEFQENQGLCPWALSNNNIQKKQIFGLREKAHKRNLWKVVIDTTDIEFVTEPFTYQQRPHLEEAIDTINHALGFLQYHFKSHGSISFEEWIDKMEEAGVGKSNNSYCFVFFDTYNSVRYEDIIRPSPQWKPRFSPQATIQHSLEFAIPLYFGLFGFDTDYMLQFVPSLPYGGIFRNEISKAQKKADSQIFETWSRGYQQKINGLVFLHALTLAQLAPVDEMEDSGLLQETLDCQSRFLQVDAKLKLNLMSRRPFSAMFQGIHTQGSYETYFKKVMSTNLGFKDVPKLFYKTNYAEQYFDPQTGTPKSLMHLLPLFRKEFRDQNQDVLTKLLEQGILSTTMIRKFKKDVKVDNIFPVASLFHNYFEDAIKTVDNPQTSVTINVDNGSVHSVPVTYDVISPPYFLNFDNSMGAFKNPLAEEDKQYGEAIIEIRSIRDVQSWFLKRCKLDPSKTQRKFLTKPGAKLRKHVLAMFDFLNDFGTGQDVIEIFYLGIPYAVSKY